MTGGITPAFAAEGAAGADTAVTTTKAGDNAGKDKGKTKTDGATKAKTDKGTDKSKGKGASKDKAKTDSKDKAKGDHKDGSKDKSKDMTPAPGKDGVKDKGKTKDPNAGVDMTTNPGKDAGKDKGKNDTKPGEDKGKTDTGAAATITVYGFTIDASAVVDGALTDAGKAALDKAINESAVAKGFESVTCDNFGKLLAASKIEATTEAKMEAKAFDTAVAAHIKSMLDTKVSGASEADAKLVGDYIVDGLVKKAHAAGMRCEVITHDDSHDKPGDDTKPGDNTDGDKDPIVGGSTQGGSSDNNITINPGTDKDKGGSSEMKTPIIIAVFLGLLAALVNFVMTNPQFKALLPHA